MSLLDGPKAANFFGDSGEGDGDIVIGEGQVSREFREQMLIVGDQPTFGPPLGRIANGSKTVPRKNLNRARTAKTLSIQGPKDIFRGSPVAGSRRASNGGAK